MSGGSRQDQWLNTLTIDGKSYGVWDTMTGGDVEATETKYKPGGMQPETSLGGSTSVSNITLGKLLKAERDWDLIRGLMAARVGKAECLVARQPLDVDANPVGKPITYSGILNQVNPGDTDASSTSAQTWTIVVSTRGTIS
jgi:hypothetical protein